MEIVIILIIILISALSLVILSFTILIVLFYTRVPFVRTPKKVIDLVIQQANIKSSDKVYDLGCGDARVLLAIKKRTGAQTIGFEISPWAYFLANLKIWLGKSKTKVFYKNFYKQNLAPADVVFCFLIDSVMPKVAKQLAQQLKPGARVISFAFAIKEWTPVKVIETKPGKKTASKIYIYQL